VEFWKLRGASGFDNGVLDAKTRILGVRAGWETQLVRGRNMDLTIA
jgi:hypothetical protein